MKGYYEIEAEMEASDQSRYIKELEKNLEEKKNRRQNTMLISSLVIIISLAAACNPRFRQESPQITGFLLTGLPFVCAAFALWIANVTKKDILSLDYNVNAEKDRLRDKKLRLLPPAENVAEDVIRRFGSNFDPAKPGCINPIIDALEGEAIREGRSLKANDANNAALALVNRILNSMTRNKK